MNGVVYCAIGQKYLTMAETSARSVRQHNKNVAIKIFTDVEPAAGLFDVVERVPANTRNRDIKLTVGVACPFDNTVYLDTDTLVLAPLDPIYSVLQHYDLAVCIAQRSRLAYYSPNVIQRLAVDKDLTHFAGGVYGFRKSVSPWFFERWLANYNALIKYTKLDQLSFSYTIWSNAVSIYPLSSSWNVRPEWGDAVYGEIKILHSPHMLQDKSLRAYMANKTAFDNPAAGPRWVKN